MKSNIILEEPKPSASTLCIICITFGTLSSLTTSKGFIVVISTLVLVCISALIVQNKQIKCREQTQKIKTDFTYTTTTAKVAGLSLAGIIVMQLIFSIIVLPVIARGLPDSSSALREGLGTPIQQVTWVEKVNGNISDKDREKINHFFNLEAACSKYKSDTSDKAKENVYQGAGIQDALLFIDAYLSIGLNNPKEYAKSFIDLYEGYWKVGGVDSLMIPRLMPNSDSGSSINWTDSSLFSFPGSINDARTGLRND